jgi:hypothetical protein
MRFTFLPTLLATVLSWQLSAQTVSSSDDNDVRFGLRISPQPSWFSSADKNSSANGIAFGYGFGLNMEFKLTSAASLLTGIGGDFEGGKIKYRNDPANNFQVCYVKDEADAFVQPKSTAPVSDLKKPGNTIYVVSERKISTTYVTLPLIIKLSTKEITGMKYFGLFGAEVGFRVKAKASDTYLDIRKYKSDTTYESQALGTVSDIDINKDASLIPLRVGLNVGAGFEYRLVGNTAFFCSFNYFNSFTNLMRNESKYMIYNWQTIDAAKGNSTITYKMFSQNLIAKAVRINIGIMF